MTELAERSALPRVEAALGRALTEARDRASAVGSGVSGLWDALLDAAHDGKRVRPLLLLDTHTALGGRRDDAALQVATAFEVLHLAFCVHDDVIDEDAIRRGRATVWARYQRSARAIGAHEPHALAAGVAAGILAGDLLLTLAVRLVATAPLGSDEDMRLDLLDLLDDVVQRTASGELDDVLGPVRPGSVTLADAVSTAAQKTAEYSFVGPVVAGAVLAGAPAAVVDTLGASARALGTAYQLTDDLLGTFGEESVTGKSTRSDLAEGKVTALVVLARETAAWPMLARYLGDREVSEAAAAGVRRELERTGVRARAEQLVELHTASALHMLGHPAVPPSVREVLERHAAALTGRQR